MTKYIAKNPGVFLGRFWDRDDVLDTEQIMIGDRKIPDLIFEEVGKKPSSKPEKPDSNVIGPEDFEPKEFKAFTEAELMEMKPKVIGEHYKEFFGNEIRTTGVSKENIVKAYLEMQEKFSPGKI